MKFAVTASLTIKGLSKNREFDISFEETAFYADEGEYWVDAGLLSQDKGAYRYVAKHKILYLKTFDDYTFYHLVISNKTAATLLTLRDFDYPPKMGATGKGLITLEGAAAMPSGRIKWTVKTAPTGLSNDEKAEILGGGLY